MGGSGCSSPLPAPRPKSPPEYPDLYGKRRELARVQLLEREIGFLQEELKFIEGLQPASRCCKDVVDSVVANSDPLIPTGASCFSFSWICCYGCCPSIEVPHCCNCNLCNCRSCFNCLVPKCKCFSWPRSQCFRKSSCNRRCCSLQCPSCQDCCCCSRWTCSCPKCPEVHCCSDGGTKSCCYPCCCLCY